MKPTAEQIKAALAITRAIADAIRELGSIPSGELYARVMGHMSLENYEKVIATLIGAGLVRRDNSHMLTWAVQ